MDDAKARCQVTKRAVHDCEAPDGQAVFSAAARRYGIEAIEENDQIYRPTSVPLRGLRRIEHFLESQPVGQIVMSFPRAGHVRDAWMLSEPGDVRERFRIFVRAWLRVIWRAWTDRTSHDPKCHAGALKLSSSEGG